MKYMPQFPEHYRLILYRLGGGNKPELQAQAIEMCHDAFLQSPIHSIEHDGVLLVLEESCPSAEAARLLEEMNEKLGIQVRAAATEVYHGLDGLHPAWMQLINIECCAKEGEQDHVLTSRDLPETQRLAKAYRMLTQTDASITQVAQECGFNSPNSFYKAFKRRYGMAPRSLN